MSSRITTIVCDRCDEVLDQVAIREGEHIPARTIRYLLDVHICKGGST